MTDNGGWIITRDGLKTEQELLDEYQAGLTFKCPRGCEEMGLRFGWKCTHPWDGNFTCDNDAVYGCGKCSGAVCQEHLSDLS